MNNGKRIIGIILIIVSIVGMICWEKWGREILFYKEIVVINRDVEKNTIITSDMLETKKIQNPSNDALTTKTLRDLIGKESVQYIHKSTEIFGRYFESSKLNVNKEKDVYIMSIPNNWLKSYPQTLRRGDTAYFYVDGNFITSAIVAYAKDGLNQEVVSEDETRLSGSSTVSLVEVVVDQNQVNTIGEIAKQGKEFVILYN